MNRFAIGSLSTLIIVLSGCNSIPSGATMVSSDQIRSSLAGYTWVWDDGGPGAGIYFAKNGQAAAHWKGESFNTTWSTRDGAFCYKGPDKDRCWAFYEKDGVTYARAQWDAGYRDPFPWADETVRRGRHVP